jgi:hypothetical protein
MVAVYCLFDFKDLHLAHARCFLIFVHTVHIYVFYVSVTIKHDDLLVFVRESRVLCVRLELCASKGTSQGMSRSSSLFRKDQKVSKQNEPTTLEALQSRHLNTYRIWYLEKEILH